MLQMLQMIHDVSFLWFRLFRHGPEPGWVVSRLGIAPSGATAQDTATWCNLVPLWLGLQQIATTNNFHLSWSPGIDFSSNSSSQKLK